MKKTKQMTPLHSLRNVLNCKTYADVLAWFAMNGTQDGADALCLFLCHCKVHGIAPYVRGTGFFDDGEPFAQFLKSPIDGKTLNAYHRAWRERNVRNRKAQALIEKGERLIRKGYEMRDAISFVHVAAHNALGTRHHIVDLLGTKGGAK